MCFSLTSEASIVAFIGIIIVKRIGQWLSPSLTKQDGIFFGPRPPPHSFEEAEEKGGFPLSIGTTTSMLRSGEETVCLLPKTVNEVKELLMKGIGKGYVRGLTHLDGNASFRNRETHQLNNLTWQKVFGYFNLQPRTVESVPISCIDKQDTPTTEEYVEKYLDRELGSFPGLFPVATKRPKLQTKPIKRWRRSYRPSWDKSLVNKSLKPIFEFIY